MKYSLIIFLILTPFIGISQSNEESLYKNDIAIIYGANLDNFNKKIPGLEYRRSINENWKLKIAAMAERQIQNVSTIHKTSFALSDSSKMSRRQLLSLHVGRTLKIGADYTGFKHFSIGAQFIFGNGFGDSYVSDQVFYNISEEEYSPEYVYSEELTDAYHPTEPQPNAGTIEIGQRTENVSYLSHWTYGLGLTGEAKWPIGKHFEAALQYNPEIMYFQIRDQFDNFDLDGNVNTDYENVIDMNHFANLFLRFKF